MLRMAGVTVSEPTRQEQKGGLTPHFQLIGSYRVRILMRNILSIPDVFPIYLYAIFTEDDPPYRYNPMIRAYCITWIADNIVISFIVVCTQLKFCKHACNGILQLISFVLLLFPVIPCNLCAIFKYVHIKSVNERSSFYKMSDGRPYYAIEGCTNSGIRSSSSVVVLAVRLFRQNGIRFHDPMHHCRLGETMNRITS